MERITDFMVEAWFIRAIVAEVGTYPEPIRSGIENHIKWLIV
jgi:hypothetical protein